MKSDLIESYRVLAMAGPQGKKSDAIRTLCDEIDRLQQRSVKRNGFIPPTIEELKSYAREITVHSLGECETFRDHYESNGWMVGRVRMVDWKAAFRRWTRKQRSTSTNGHCPQGWEEFLKQTRGRNHFGDYQHAPEYVKIEFATWRRQQKG